MRHTLWANPTIQLLNFHPEFSLSYLGDREAVRHLHRTAFGAVQVRTEGEKWTPSLFARNSSHKLRSFLGGSSSVHWSYSVLCWLWQVEESNRYRL